MLLAPRAQWRLAVVLEFCARESSGKATVEALSVPGGTPSAMQAAAASSDTKLQKEGIFFPRPFICRRYFINKKVGNRRK